MEPISIILGLFVSGLLIITQQIEKKDDNKEAIKAKQNKQQSNDNVIVTVHSKGDRVVEIKFFDGSEGNKDLVKNKGK